MTADAPIHARNVTHRYGQRVALDDVSLDVPPGVVFGLLGPNGGGKTTLFRILTTAMKPDQGQVTVCGHDVAGSPGAVRPLIGVAFQSPSLDRKLTVEENIRHQGHLYGLSGAALRERGRELLSRFGVADRARDRVETLSGGLARRVDLAKALLHRPRVLLLDEPSTGLDPQARWELWRLLDKARREEGLTVLMTTHFMDEADRCDLVGILDRGKLVANGSPEQLKRAIAGDCLNLEAEDAGGLAGEIRTRFDAGAMLVDGRVRIERERAHELIPPLMEAFGPRIQALSLSRPSLEEVFIRQTGRGWEQGGEASSEK